MFPTDCEDLFYIRRSLIRVGKAMRVFTGARPVTSLVFQRAEMRHFKLRVSVILSLVLVFLIGVV